MRHGLGLYLGRRSGGEALPLGLQAAQYWVDADDATHGGDGTEATAFNDLSGAGNVITKHAAGGPTWYANRFAGGRACFYLAANKGIITVGTGNPIVAALNGLAISAVRWTAWIVWQPIHHLVNIPFSWSKTTASSRGVICRWNSNAYKPQMYGGGNPSAFAIVDAPKWQPHPVPKISVIRHNGSTVTYGKDGKYQAPVACPWTGTYDTDSFNIGCQNTTTSVFSFGCLIARVVVTPLELDDDQCNAVVRKLAQLSFPVLWKEGWGAKGAWKLSTHKGQSDCTGYCLGSPDYSNNAPKTYAMHLDGGVRPTQCVDQAGTNDASPSLAFQASAGPGYRPAFAERMISSGIIGPGENHLMIVTSMISTDSAAWVSGLTDDPPSINTLNGYHKHRVADGLEIPGGVIINEHTDQWQASTDDETEAAALETDYDNYCTNFDAFVSANGGTWLNATCKFTFTLPAAASAGHGAFKAEADAALDSLIAGRSDCAGVISRNPTCEATPGLHRIGTEQQAQGQDIGDLVVSKLP